MKYCHPLASVADFSFRSRHFNSGLWRRTSVWLNGMSSFFVVVVIKCVPLLKNIIVSFGGAYFVFNYYEITAKYEVILILLN